MPPLSGHPPTQTAGADQAEHAQGPEVLSNPSTRLWGFASRMREHSVADSESGHAQAADAADADTTTGSSPARAGLIAGTGILAGVASAAILIPGGASASDAPGSNVDVEKAALAAFGSKAITRSVDSFPAPEAQASGGGKRVMKPSGVLRAIDRTVRSTLGSSGVLSLRVAKMTSKSSVLQGRCKPRDGYDAKKEVTKNGKTTLVYCVGGRESMELDAPVDYSNSLNKLGNKAATSAGISVESHGGATKAIATNRRATISFANDDPEAADRQLKTLVLRTGKKPTKQWYPPQTTEAQ